MVGFFFSIFLPTLTAWLALRRVLPCWRNSPAFALLRLSLAAVIGPSLAGILFYLWLMAAGGATRWYIIFETLLLLTLCVILTRIKARRPVAPPPLAAVQDVSPLRRLCLVALVLVFSLAVANHVLLTTQMPQGAWDAWAIWNLRARFLACGTTAWSNGFTNQIGWSHPDYPLLLPSLVARSWTFVGDQSWWVPAILALLFTLSIAGIAGSVVTILRGNIAGMLTAATLLGADYIIRHSAYQYADTPLAYWVAACVGLFLLAELAGEPRRLYFLAGLAGGLGAWTKNEGLIPLMLMLVMLAARDMWRRGHQRTIPAIWFVIGWLPLAILLAHFKWRYAPVNDLVAGFEARAAWEKVIDLTRHRDVLTYLVRKTISFSKGLPIVGLILLMLLGRSRRALHAIGFSACVLVLTWCAYYAIYILTPHDLHWHLGTSARRLLLHLAPAAIMLFYLYVRSPVELLRPSTDTQHTTHTS